MLLIVSTLVKNVDLSELIKAVIRTIFEEVNPIAYALSLTVILFQQDTFDVVLTSPLDSTDVIISSKIT